jgi:uncharacterized surface protein with fasciclin (FAS1) repeats
VAAPIEERVVNLVRRAAFAAAVGIALPAGTVAMLAAAELSVEVGGVPMVASRTIVENLGASKDHETLVAAIEAAGLSEVLQGEGPFTVFAPVDTAFDKLPKGTLATLLEPASKEKLVALLANHVVPGRYSAADLVIAAEKAGGKAKLATLGGSELLVSHDGRKLEVFDAEGGKAIVVLPDATQKNGVVHVVDKVLQPRD